jgi:sorting nexin-13
VFGVARQVLSLVAGGAIDEWLLSHLRALRQEHATARLLHALQQQLWPGGAWFQSLPENQHPVRAPCRVYEPCRLSYRFVSGPGGDGAPS